MPEALRPFVKTIWTLDAGGDGAENLTNEALPDGCIEVIRRLNGSSSWHRSQPAVFAAGICSKPAVLELSGDASFIGVRLWPWAWNQISDCPATLFHDDWIALDDNSAVARLVSNPAGPLTSVLQVFSPYLPDSIGKHVPSVSTTGELALASGKGHRTIQRWFGKEIGHPPRKYFKLLRFQNAIAEPDKDGGSLAMEAATLGYADQSHMARNFKEFAGSTTRQVRKSAQGPFLADKR